MVDKIERIIFITKLPAFNLKLLLSLISCFIGLFISFDHKRKNK